MTYSIQIPCNKHNLKKVRSFVEDILGNYYISASDINLIVLAIDEMCANLIIHSHKCNAEEHIELKIKDENGKFVFEIHESSPECFNLVDYKLPEMKQLISEKRNGGIGLILVRKIMDDIQLERRGSYNIYRLVKAVARTNC